MYLVVVATLFVRISFCSSSDNAMYVFVVRVCVGHFAGVVNGIACYFRGCQRLCFARECSNRSGDAFFSLLFRAARRVKRVLRIESFIFSLFHLHLCSAGTLFHNMSANKYAGLPDIVELMPRSRSALILMSRIIRTLLQMSTRRRTSFHRV